MGERLAAFGWDDMWAATFAVHAEHGHVPGRVTAVHRETSIVATSAGEVSAAVTGRFRRDALAPSDFPAVGDWVALDGAVIATVAPRRSAFRRYAADSSRRATMNLVDEQVIAANVDIAFLVAGLDGDFNLRRLERYLAVSWSSGVDPIVVLNKADIADDLDGRLSAVEAIAPSVPILVLSALTGDRLADLTPHLAPGRTAVVLGSSGVGKSTLVNALLGEERKATAEVRADDSRGRHTTTHRELFTLPTGALLIDTPGIRSLEVVGAAEGIEAAFDDVLEVAAGCRFSDCRHEGEPGCAVRAAITDGTLSEERLAGHRKLEREVAHAARRVDPRAAAEERRRWRVLQKAVSRHIEAKYGGDEE
jgi:ribosome biogenesis GTPase / thiamine phosphate phosphatase